MSNPIRKLTSRDLEWALIRQPVPPRLIGDLVDGREYQGDAMFDLDADLLDAPRTAEGRTNRRLLAENPESERVRRWRLARAAMWEAEYAARYADRDADSQEGFEYRGHYDGRTLLHLGIVGVAALILAVGTLLMAGALIHNLVSGAFSPLPR